MAFLSLEVGTTLAFPMRAKLAYGELGQPCLAEQWLSILQMKKQLPKFCWLLIQST